MDIKLNPKPMMQAIEECLKVIDINDVKTQEDIAAWCTNRAFRLTLKKMLENYFSTRYIFYKVQVNEKNIDFLRLRFDEYIALYEFLNKAWEEIEPVLKHIQTPIRSPGEALIFILKNDTKQAWNNRNNQLKPDTLYRGYSEAKKLESMLLQTSSDAKKQEIALKKTTAYYKRAVKQTGRKFSDRLEHEFFLETCIHICNHSKNTWAKDALKNYQFAVWKSIDFAHKALRKKL